MSADHDTIAAPATAAGGALSVVRISGPAAFAICDRLFRGRTPLCEARGNTVHYGHIVTPARTLDPAGAFDSARTLDPIYPPDPAGASDSARTLDSTYTLDPARTLDDVLATVFRAPHSYTGEDSVEISCHGSSYITAELLRLLVAAGARMAEPGEFTIRAYLAGKLDLSQAEAVADLIASSSRAAHALASNQMRGGYSQALEVLRDKLLTLTSLLELELDFAEEEVEFADRNALRNTMLQINTEISALRQSFSLGNAIKEGVAVAIVGAPNVGKSTLLNRLLGEDRAMVSDIAGTTRDVIEERMNIDGVVFRFLDTAGIRSTDDRLEQMGIERTLSSIKQAQIIVYMADAVDSQEAFPAPGFPVRSNQKLLKVANKVDKILSCTLPPDILRISAKGGIGIDKLCRALRAEVDTQALYHGDAVVSNSRHHAAFTEAGEALGKALQALEEGLPTDMLSEDIRRVIASLGAITGRGTITPEEVLKTIFGKFCIGK